MGVDSEGPMVFALQEGALESFLSFRRFRGTWVFKISQGF